MDERDEQRRQRCDDDRESPLLRARKAIDGEGREGERDGPYPERAEQEQHDAERRLQGTDHGSGHARTMAISQATRPDREGVPIRSEEHTSELQSLMRISYAGFCL